jgi:ATP-dependent transcriptional regulator
MKNLSYQKKFLLPRPQIELLINKAVNSPITYITAPGGFGKTSAALLWSKNFRSRLSWLVLDKFDNYPPKFYKHLLEAICQAQPSNRRLARYNNAKNEPRFSLEYLLLGIDLLLDNNKEYFLIIDDFQIITNREILHSLQLIFKKLLPKFHVIILSRKSPTGYFSEMLLKGLLKLIQESDLAFSPEEIHQLFTKKGVCLSEKQLAMIWKNTNGWPIAVNAYLLSFQEGNFADPSYSQNFHFFNYLEEQLWEHWEESTKNFLLRASTIDVLTPEIAALITGRKDSRQILHFLAKENIFIRQIVDEKYQFHQLFRSFLLSKLHKVFSAQEVNELYQKVAQFFLREKEYFISATYFSLIQDHQGLSECLTHIRNRYTNDPEEHLQMFRAILDQKLPEDFIETNLGLLIHFAWSYFLLGNKPKFMYYSQLVSQKKVHLGNSEADLDLLRTVLLIEAITPDKPLFDYLQNQEKYLKKLKKNLPKNANTIHPTPFNLPYAHRSSVDLSLCMINHEFIIPPLINFCRGTKVEYQIFLLCGYADILYEQNRLEEAHQVLLKAYDLKDSVVSPIQVAIIYMQLLLILTAMNSIDEASLLRKQLENFIKEHQLFFLSTNLPPFIYHDQTIAQAEEWLANQKQHLPEHLELYKLTQHFATAKAYLVTGKAHIALIFCKKIFSLANDFNRPLDQLESLILQAIAYWNLPKPNKKLSYQTLLQAISLAEKYRFITLFLINSTSLTPIFTGLFKQTAQKKQLLKNPFFTQLFEKINAHTPGTGPSSPQNPNPTYNISAKQKDVLHYLRDGQTYKEIASHMNIKVTTLKTHINRLYRELGVHNSREALEKAEKYSLM